MNVSVLNIDHDSVVDGEGLRTVIFFAGCPHHCLGCHNERSWDIKNGKIMDTQEVIQEILRNPLSDVTFSGGDPFFQPEAVLEIARAAKVRGKNIWSYTGYTLKQLQAIKNPAVQELLTIIDVLVDGRFEIEKKDLTLLYRGSSNQQVIHLKEALA